MSYYITFKKPSEPHFIVDDTPYYIGSADVTFILDARYEFPNPVNFDSNKEVDTTDYIEGTHEAKVIDASYEFFEDNVRLITDNINMAIVDFETSARIEAE